MEQGPQAPPAAGSLVGQEEEEEPLLLDVNHKGSAGDLIQVRTLPS
jgi:hypothetical protein